MTVGTFHPSFLAWAVGSTLLIGCSGAEAQRQAVDGSVTLDGTVLDHGFITLQPQSGTSGPTAGAEIVDGQFAIPSVKGPLAGHFRVEITASKPSGRKIPDRFGGQMIDEILQFLPARYNTESELIVEVREGEPNHFDFPLLSR